MDATLKIVCATLTMNTNEGAKHGDDDEHIHENAHQVILHFLEVLELYYQLLIRHSFVSSNTKLNSKDKTNPRKREREPSQSYKAQNFLSNGCQGWWKPNT